MNHIEDTTIPGPDYNGSKVQRCTDGKYHWTYPMNMYLNPTVYLTVCKIFGIIGAVAYIAMYIGPLFRGEFGLIVQDLKFWGIAVAVFLVISSRAYLIVAGMYGGKYVVRFTMDEKGLLHEQIPEQKEKARKLGDAVSGAGFLSGHIGRAGQGALISAHTSLSSDFSKVRRIKAYPRRGTIKVNEPLAHNQVYTSREDFDFVLQYIREHCPKVK